MNITFSVSEKTYENSFSLSLPLSHNWKLRKTGKCFLLKPCFCMINSMQAADVRRLSTAEKKSVKTH